MICSEISILGAGCQSPSILLPPKMTYISGNELILLRDSSLIENKYLTASSWDNICPLIVVADMCASEFDPRSFDQHCLASDRVDILVLDTS
jgi:hypothetical protein